MNRPYRSFFWPILILGIGVIWLLTNLGYIQAVSWATLLRLWPVLLIVAGLDLLFGRISPIIGGLIGLLAVAFIVYVLLAAPSLGLVNTPALVTDVFSEPLGNSQSANVYLDLGSVSTSIFPLDASSGDLFNATIDHYGQVRFSATGDVNKTLRLTRTPTNFNFFDTLGAQPRRWQIGLSPLAPTELTVDSGSGSVNMDLSGIQLQRLSLDSGSGSVDMSLPDAQQPYRVNLNSGSGSLDVNVPCAAGVEIHLDGGSGSQTIDAPGGCPLRVEVNDSGSGSINLPNELTRTQGQSGQDEGIWETNGYAANGPHILLVLDGHGSGSFNVR